MKICKNLAQGWGGGILVNPASISTQAISKKLEKSASPLHVHEITIKPL